MKKATMAAMLLMMFLVTGVGSVQAQGQAASQSRMFLSIDFGAQPQQRSFDTSSSFPLYDETATITTTQPIHNGPIFSVSGGYRLKPQFGVGLGYSMFASRTAESTVTASIPDLVFFSRPRTVVVTTPDLKHTEQMLHVQVVWFKPVGDQFEVVLSGGPTALYVHQDLATDVTVTPGTQNVTVAVKQEIHGGVGYNVGVEGNMFFNPRFGAGLFVRYAGGKVTLPSVEGLTVGGLQTGLGARVRF